LTAEQRAELEAADPQTIRIKLLQAGAGRTALVPGLDTALVHLRFQAFTYSSREARTLFFLPIMQAARSVLLTIFAAQMPGVSPTLAPSILTARHHQTR
jgi:hypothetical protein